jgi:hypothetical protein
VLVAGGFREKNVSFAELAKPFDVYVVGVGQLRRLICEEERAIRRPVPWTQPNTQEVVTNISVDNSVEWINRKTITQICRSLDAFDMGYGHWCVEAWVDEEDQDRLESLGAQVKLEVIGFAPDEELELFDLGLPHG